MKPYTPGAVANYFLQLGPLSPQRLQALIYFAHAWHLAYYGEPLINKPFMAWNCGPVCISVLKASTKDMIDEHNSRARVVLDSVWKAYQRFPERELLQMARSGPWEAAMQLRKHHNISRTIQIPDTALREHFLELKQARALA